MGLESATYLNDLDSANPDGDLDPRSQGDDHIKLIKAVLKATFPSLAGRVWRTQQKSSNYVLAATDNMTMIEVTATGVTLSTNVSIGTLGNGFAVLVYANGYDVTFDPNSTETMQDGSATTATIFNGEAALIFAGATRWLVHRLVSSTRQIANLTAETTFDVAADYLMFWDDSASIMRKILGQRLVEWFQPAGTLQMWASGAGAPTGWLECDGSVVAQATYPALYTNIGSAFNTGAEGAGNFRLPNFKGRSPIGVGQGSTAEGGGTGTNRTLADTGGAETHTLVTGEMPAHTHTITLDNGVGASNTLQASRAPAAGTQNSGSTGGGGAHNNMHPFLAIKFIIKAH